MMKHFNYFGKLIGNTRIINLSAFSRNPKVAIWAKLESENPSGSIKDRPAFYMVREAFEQKRITKGMEVIEPTSGNTGIALSMILAGMGIGFTAVMSESASIERRRLLEFYNAKIILTDKPKGTNYPIQIARRIARDNSKYIMLDQYENKANVISHYETTGPEILKQVPGVTHFIAGMGTGGTLVGVAKRLKEKNEKIIVIGLEPKYKTKIQGLRNMKQFKPGILSYSQVDKVIRVPDHGAFSIYNRMLQKGIGGGFSSGANLWGAIDLSGKIKSGVIVTVFPDGVDRYLSEIARG